MPRRAPAPLDQAAEHRKTRIGGQVEQRDQPADLLAGQKLGVDPVAGQGVAPFGEPGHVGIGMTQEQRAALAEHHIVVQLVGQPLPELQREFEQRLALRQAIVGAHDGGVAPRIAAADPALFEHGDGGHLVDLGQVVGRGQPMAAPPDDDDVVGGLGLGRAPGAGP